MLEEDRLGQVVKRDNEVNCAVLKRKFARYSHSVASEVYVHHSR